MKKALKYGSLVTASLAVLSLAGLRGTTAADGGGNSNLGGAAVITPPELFDEAAIYLEFNFSANDAGIHIDTDQGVGLREMAVVGPTGASVREGKWFDALGLTEMRTESAEPSPERTLRAWPPGIYRFIGRTVDGTLLQSEATLSHRLLPPPTITFPADGATGVSASGVTVLWAPVRDAESYFLEFSGPAGKLETFLPPTRNSFAVPAGLLAPNAVHKLGVASIHENGNLSLAEIEFRTAR